VARIARPGVCRAGGAEAEMTAHEIHARVATILHTDFARAQPLLTPTATLGGTLMLDSLDLVDLAFFLEREFGLEARADHLREVKTLEGLVAFVQARAA